MKFNRLFSVVAVFFLAVVACAQGGAQNRGTAEATIKGKKITITYGRPSLKGRDMLGQAPVGTVWRVGANQATEIETAADLKIGSTVLKAGKYSLWAKKTGDNTWVLAFHPKTGVWGAPPLKEGYVAELPMTLSTAGTPEEMVTITLSENKGNGTVKIQWGTAVMTGNFGVS